MYNSLLKFYIKGLIGKKNTSWNSDKLSFGYLRKNKLQNSDFIVWANNQAEIEDELISSALSGKCPEGFSINPLFIEGFELRQSSLNSNKNKHIKRPVKFFIHLPDAQFSMGGHSWFYSLGMTLKYQGIDVDFFWGKEYKPNFISDVENIIISSYNEIYLDSLNQDYIIEASNKFQIRVGFTFPNHESDLQSINNFINRVKIFKNIFFYTFYDIDFFKNSNFTNALSILKIPLLNIPFAANPLYHFPAPFIQKRFDYIFLGSSNYEKVDRYYKYFYPIIDNFNGFIGGPGWDWETDFVYNPKRDKYMYASAKVALNLHIDEQIMAATELNERTYILSACGQSQVVDNAALLEKNFKNILIGYSNPQEYFTKVHAIINSSVNYMHLSDILKYTYNTHLTFHRTDIFLKNFNIN